MPDIFDVTARRWKTMLLITVLSTLIAFVACLISPKKHLGEVTALPSNAETGDRARIFNQNIEGLYRELGEPDELDRIEGTAKLDTIYLAIAKQFRLYANNPDTQSDVLALHNAAKDLKKNTRIYRTGYGELKIKVWDKNPQTAAALANAMVEELNTIHQQLRNKNNLLVLQRLKEDYAKQRGPGAPIQDADSVLTTTSAFRTSQATGEQLAMYTRLINEYELALKINPDVLLVVEPARPLPWHDKPNTAQVVVFAFLASLFFSFLLVFLAESRQRKV